MSVLDHKYLIDKKIQTGFQLCEEFGYAADKTGLSVALELIIYKGGKVRRIDSMSREDELHIAVTGHRKWANFDQEREDFENCLTRLLSLFRAHGIMLRRLKFITGCARGVDLWFAEYALNWNIGLHCYLPFKRITQIVKSHMNPKERSLLNFMIDQAEKVVVVNETYFIQGYQKRNIAIVNNCDLLLSYYTRSRSGSGNAVRYAEKIDKWNIELRKWKDVRDWKVLDLEHLVEYLM